MAPSPSSPVRVRDVLVSAVPELRDRMFEEAIRQNWTRVVGPDLSGRSRPGSLKMGTLDVLVDNSPFLHEMTLRSGELLAAVQASHGPAVSSLRFSPAPPLTQSSARWAAGEDGSWLCPLALEEWPMVTNRERTCRSQCASARSAHSKRRGLAPHRHGACEEESPSARRSRTLNRATSLVHFW